MADTQYDSHLRMPPLAVVSPVPSAEVQVSRLQKRLDRERLARLETEAISEKTLAELYLKQQELEARQDELRLIQAITVAANESDTFEEALSQALALVCRHMSWPIGHAWKVTPDETSLVSAKIWSLAEPDRFRHFLRITEDSSFSTGQGLPGQVLATRQPIWIENLAASDNFPRFDLCQGLPLCAGLAFPIVSGTYLVAVLEFFTDQARPPNPALLELLAHIGTQMGRVVERERAREAMQWQAYHDALTDLPNRSLFQDRLTQVVSLAQRRDQRAAVLFLDLDRFKQVNDTLGHMAGDRMLREVARRLHQCLRAEDTLARMGGDEFTVLLPHVAHADQALKVGRKLLEALAPPISIDGHRLFISGSIGISLFPDDGQDSETLLRHADASMYRCKEQGGGCQLYTQEMDRAAQERLMLENQLRQALTRQEMTLFYQPQREMSSGRVSGLEALIRWRHPSLGLVPPQRFIPLAEETGLILPLGQWVMEEATRQAARWRQAGNPVRVAVNLSARQFEQRDLVASVARVLDQSGLPPALLELEITETVLMARGDGVIKTLHALKDLGVRLAVDDFGTGYSSLAYLRHFAVDVLKLDRAFVRGLGVGEADTAIVRAVIDLAHALRLEVVAEGVETEQQRQILDRLGCDILQGYLICHPLPADDLARRTDIWRCDAMSGRPCLAA